MPEVVWQGGQLPPPQFLAAQLTLFQTDGADFAHHITNSRPPPRFFDVAPPLIHNYMIVFKFKFPINLKSDTRLVQVYHKVDRIWNSYSCHEVQELNFMNSFFLNFRILRWLLGNIAQIRLHLAI